MIAEERERIAAALTLWVNSGYNGAKTAKILKVNYFTLNKWINRHYMYMVSSENTITLTKESKV